MQSLRGRRIVYELYFKGVSLPELVAGELDHGGVGAKQSIGADGIKFVIETKIVILFSYGLLK